MKATKEESESEREVRVRKLRDLVYGPGSDNNWEGCKQNWLRAEETAWLEDWVERKIKQQK